MVDPEKIRQKLKYLESSLAYLRKLAALSKDEFFGDFRNVDSAIHRLQTSIEAMARNDFCRGGLTRATSQHK